MPIIIMLKELQQIRQATIIIFWNKLDRKLPWSSSAPEFEVAFSEGSF